MYESKIEIGGLKEFIEVIKISRSFRIIFFFFILHFSHFCFIISIAKIINL